MGDELIGMVKTNTKGFCKQTIEKITKDWPGGSYHVLRSKLMVPRDRPLIAIGYKYIAWKVLSFIVTDNVGSTKTGIPYFYKYPDQCTIVAIRPVAHPLVMSKQNLLLMRLNPTSNQYNLIWHWRSGELLNIVGCGYIQ